MAILGCTPNFTPTRNTQMQFMSFHPVVGDIGAQVVNISIDGLEAGARASVSLTELVPAGADELSAQAVMAFASAGAQMLALNKAAHEELMRAGAAFTHIARIYTEIDEASARILLEFTRYRT
jgi:hypothetical protein